MNIFATQGSPALHMRVEAFWMCSTILLNFKDKEHNTMNKPVEHRVYASSEQREGHGVPTHAAFEVVDPKS